MALAIVLAVTAGSGPAALPTLRVCADPNNLPFSNRAGEGFENRIAELLAARGALPPVLTSASVVGSVRSRELFDAAYAEHARRLANVLRTRPD